MLYLIITISTLLLIFTITFIQKIFQNKNIDLFLTLKINLILYFYKIFFFSFILILSFLMLYNIINSTFFIIQDIIQNVYNTSSTQCAGVQKLVEVGSREIYTNQFYIENKTLFKYNFSFLERNKNFNKNRLTIIELGSICSELNSIYNNNVNIFKYILTTERILNIKNEEDIFLIKKEINTFYYQNIFLKQNLKLVNIKLGIPLYREFYNQVLRSPEYLTFIIEEIFQKKYIDIRIDIKNTISYNIASFLETEFLNKNINYFDISLSLDKEDRLICLPKNLTVNAVTFDNIKITDRPFLNRKLINNHEVICTILDNSGAKIEVKDLIIQSETPNGTRKPDILIGGLGIVESYVYYIKSMSKTISILNSNNFKLKELTNLLSYTNYREKIVSNNILLNNTPKLNFLEFYESRIIDKIVISDAKILFKEDGILLDINTTSKYKKLNNIFLKQLNRDPSMLKDIYTQQSGMHVNYSKLIQVMKNPDLEYKNYFNQNINNRILNASEGNFSLKRSR